ncbi:MAG: LTA synthase family protein [Bacteroidetes bacterium]|nr:LTA synthase family protein [Bacteroidota bacterium]
MFLNGTLEIISTFFKSILFDVLSCFLYFIPYICLLFCLLFLKEMKRWQLRLLTVYFSVLFWMVSILSFADIFYYKFNLRRINIETLQLLSDSKSSIFNFGITHPFSILLLAFIGLSYYFSIKKTTVRGYTLILPPPIKKVLIGSLIFVALVSNLFLWFAKYLSPMSASLLVSAGYTGLYTNSPQVFLYSLRSGWTYVKPLQYFSDSEADKLVPVFYANASPVPYKGRNIVVFILESFSYSYLDKHNTDKPYTPFFDSLINHSTFYTNAYANNTTSANGLCSILSGIPSLMNQPYFSSAYASNPVSSIGLALKKNGYQTNFFLGANDDHFGFKKGTKLLGIDNYFHGEEFAKSQHDGTWGIYDEPFLQFFAAQSEQMKQPFFSKFFTISSHFPFKVPDSLINAFPTKHNYANERAVSYVDYSFKKFFEKVEKTTWFQNTVFIFTADHVSKENTRESATFNFNSYYHIPIFIFDPTNPQGKEVSNLVQHTDIPPTIAQLTGIPDTILSFGRSFFDSTTYHYTVNRYSENIVQFIDTSILLQYDLISNRLLDLYAIEANDALKKITDQGQLNDAHRKVVPLLKAYMQQYFNRHYYNRLYR